MALRNKALVAGAGLALGAAAPSPARAQLADSSLLTLDRLFSSSDFRAKEFGPAQWISGGVYTPVEPRAGGAGTDIVRYDAATGARTIFVPAARLIPAGDSAPMAIEDYTVSPDGRHVLVFTNSRRVWRQRTRGDFWLVDLTTWALRELGGGGAPA